MIVITLLIYVVAICTDIFLVCFEISVLNILRLYLKLSISHQKKYHIILKSKEYIKYTLVKGSALVNDSLIFIYKHELSWSVRF